MIEDDFEYVVQPKVQQHVSFGTTQERDISLIRPKYNRTSIKYTPEFFPNVSPFSYDINKKRVTQHSALSSHTSRFKRVLIEGPSPTTYELQRFPNPVRESLVPFNKKASGDVPTSKIDSNPGPGTYNPTDDFSHILKYYQYFGRRKIQVKAPNNVEDLHNKCNLCHSQPIKNGDPFWKNITRDKSIEDVRCCACMLNLKKEALKDLKKKAIVKKYRMVCECPYYNRHAGMPNYRVINYANENQLPREAIFDKFLHTVKEEEKDE